MYSVLEFIISKIVHIFDKIIRLIKNSIEDFKDTKVYYYMKWGIKIILSYIVWVHFVFIAVMFVLIMFYKFFSPSISSLMIYRNINAGQKIQKIVFIPLKWTTYQTQNMFIMAEDYKFYHHFGFDLEAIGQAYSINKKYNLKLFGGSTITQQIARTLFLVPKKTYLRKYAEFIIACEMELFLGKKRILELYLNYVEMGNGVFGIGRASLVYYGKSFYKINYDQTARLVAILPSPLRFNPENFYLNEQLLSRYNFLISRANN